MKLLATFVAALLVNISVGYLIYTALLAQGADAALAFIAMFLVQCVAALSVFGVSAIVFGE